MAQATSYYQNLSSNIGNISLNMQVFYTITKHALKDVNHIRIEENQNLFTGKNAISCKIADNKIMITIEVSVAYGHNVSKICEEIQEKVTQAIYNMCKVNVDYVNVVVTGIDFD